MKIAIIGGGPAGLYFSILMKKAYPDVTIEVIERNRPDDTFGWGVVFSDETLSAFESADLESYDEITREFKYWRDIETFYRGSKVVSTGHGFCALARKTLLLILQRRCRDLGVVLRFEQEVKSLEDFADHELLIGADGVNSWTRSRLSGHFKPDLDWRQCRFVWLGTDKPLDAFTFIFKETPHGLFQVHAYPFEDGLSTWIVECREEVWRAAGLESADEEATLGFCRELFAEDLDGYRLLTNRSIWRRFPTVRCRTWHWSKDRHGSTAETTASDRLPGHVLLLGDSAHTAHFSIGSGTKLAMEDAIALVDEFVRVGLDNIPKVLHEYEENRWVDVAKLQKAAQTSLDWFENSARYLGQHPLQFSFNLMTRSKRITFDNLGRRDPDLVSRVAEQFRIAEGAEPTSDGRCPVPVFTPFRLRDLTLNNRLVVSPMCQYSATDGVVNDWHLVHLGSRAVGEPGLILTEMTDVSPEGRITLGCAGLWNDEQTDAWRRIVDFVHVNSDSKIGVQLAHAGRKGSTIHPWDGDDAPLPEEQGGWQTLGPSALPFRDHWPAPKAMDRQDMDRVRDAFVSATRRALAADFDLVEIHMAHGYLLSSFLSPLSNHRQDEYGGSLENRMRYPLEVFQAMRRVWPPERPMIVRISATDWLGSRGTTIDDSVELSQRLMAEGCDLVDVSTAGNSPESRPDYGRMYQVPFAEQIRHRVGMPVMAVGAVLNADQANTILAAGRADLVAMARPHLRDAYLTRQAAETYQYFDQRWPGQYLRGAPQPAKGAQRKSDPR